MPLILPNAPAEEVNPLPSPGDNLFGRLIRDPNRPGKPPRERECTEMLCGVLLNAPALRSLVLDRLAELAGVVPLDWDGLRLTWQTEAKVTGGKRDDLRLEAVDPETGRLLLVWTIEVKVQAGFHHSIDVEDGESLAHQLVNYDRWLSGMRGVGQRLGFVLSVERLDDSMPQGLENTWTCFTWWDLRGVLEDAIAESDLPSPDRPPRCPPRGVHSPGIWRDGESPWQMRMFRSMT